MSATTVARQRVALLKPRLYTPAVRLQFALAVAFALGACRVGPEGTPDAQTDQQGSTAVLFVERQAADQSGTSAHIGARFVQYSGMAPESLSDLLGTPPDLGTSSGCTVRVAPAIDTDGRAEARLLDVGTIEVQAGEQTIHLEPRRFPNLWNVVSGVIYAADGELSPDRWRFAAPGNVQTRVGAFDIEAHAPEELADVTVADQALSPGGIVMVPRRAFGLRWLRGDRDDSVVVTFDGGATIDHPEVIVCSTRDEGTLEIDATWAERIVDVVRAGATITVHRLRSRPFVVTQLDNAHIVFDLSLRGRARAE